MATGQTDRELLLALMRNSGVIPNLDPFTYPQNAPNVPKEFGQEVLEFAQALERNPNRRATGLEEVVELIGKMGVINPLKTAGSLMQLDKPTVERMAQSGVEAAKRAYDDPSGTANRLAQGAKEALLDPVGTAGELSVSDVAGGSGLLSKLAGAANLTGPALMAAMVPGSDVPRPKRSESKAIVDASKRVDSPNIQTLKGFEESITTKYPDVEEFSLYSVGDDIELDRIVVNEYSRNKGVGTDVMKELIDYADQNGKRLILTTNQADQQLGTTSSGRLKDFYKQFGFVENVGENKDFRIKSNMYRSPIVADDAEERARQMQKASFGTPAFHGTTHDIQEFTLERSNPENYLGQAHYFSSSPIDASENYGGQGPDLTIRIDREMEDLSYLTDNELKEIVSKEVADQFDKNMKRVDKSKQEDLRQSLLREAAKENLTTHEGAVMDVQLQLKNPLYIDGSDKEQRFKLETVYDDEGNIVEEKGNLVDLHQAIVEAGYEFDGGDGDELARMFMAHSDDYFGDKMYDEGLTATDVNYILQNMEKSNLYTDDGSFAGNEFIRQVYENLGHDSVVMDASKAFKMMGNVPEGTKHYIVFDKYANQIRSRRATFDPKKADSRNILASTLPIGLGAGAAAASYSANKEE